MNCNWRCSLEAITCTIYFGMISKMTCNQEIREVTTNLCGNHNHSYTHTKPFFHLNAFQQIELNVFQALCMSKFIKQQIFNNMQICYGMKLRSCVSLLQQGTYQNQTSDHINLPFPFSRMVGHANDVSSNTSRTSFCWRPALSANAIPSASPARVTPAISCSTRFILDAFPTSPVTIANRHKAIEHCSLTRD